MPQQNIPIGLNGLQHYITLTSSLQEIFSCEMTNGRIMGVIYYGSDCLGGYDFAIVNDTASNLKNYGKFTNSELSDLPVWYRLKPAYDFDIYFEYKNHKLYGKIESDSGDKLLLIRGLFFSGSGYIGPNIYSCDYIMENTDGGNVNVVSPLVALYPFVANNSVTMNGGTVNIGTSNLTSDAINIGTDCSSSRIVTIGNTGASSKIILRGEIETLDPTNGSVSYNGFTGATWTNVNSVAKKIGNICFISNKVTLETTDTINTNTKYPFFSVTPTNNFSNSNIILSDGIVEDNLGNINKCTIISNTNTADFQIVFYNQIIGGSTLTISTSITYIK